MDEFDDLLERRATGRLGKDRYIVVLPIVLYAVYTVIAWVGLWRSAVRKMADEASRPKAKPLHGPPLAGYSPREHGR